MTSKTIRHDRFVEIENQFIPLPDGRQLSARLWFPLATYDGEQRSPAILEYIPYRKRDGTAPRDESNYPAFAAAGYVGVRVDLAGHGESDGEFDDEYSPRELADGVDVIAYIAMQPWCTGDVGMMGISWGGFNSLQIAALRPAALKAVIAIGTTVDRYNDDIHYKNGCHLYTNLTWSSNMLCYGARAPDPALVGERWRDMWRHRLVTQPCPIITWLAHQRRDAYWQHGSIGDDYTSVDTPALVMSGWADAYINAPPAVAANFNTTAKAVNGPWIHKYPHFAWPKPRMDFTGEAIRWWDRWLKGVQNDVDALPAYRAYLSEAVRPGGRRDTEAGHWVAEQQWPSPNIDTNRFYLGEHNDLVDTPPDASCSRPRSIRTPLDCGTSCGEVFTLKADAELPGDQRSDDGGSLIFETPPLAQHIDVLGRPQLSVRVQIDQPLGNLIVRLVDVHPDGVAHRVSLGMLNLAHRHSNASPEPMVPMQAETVTISLNECGYRFKTHHRLRVSLSTSYWPYVLPPPYHATATVDLGSLTFLEIPVRHGEDTYVMPQPDLDDPLPDYTMHSPPLSRRWVERDLQTGETRYCVIEDTGDSEMPAHGLIAGERREDVYTIGVDDPLSMSVHARYSHRMRRGDWQVSVQTESELTCDLTYFYVRASVVAMEEDQVFNERHWEERIIRDCM